MALRLASRQARLVVFGYNAVTSRIEWVRSPASPQYAGSPLSLSGGQVMAYYKDGTASDITASCGYDPEEGSLLEYAGELNINASYTDHAGNEFSRGAIAGERTADTGYNPSQSTYFWLSYGGTISEYAVSRTYVPISNAAAEHYSGQIYYYMNHQYAENLDGDWGLNANARNALYLTENEIQRYYNQQYVPYATRAGVTVLSYDVWRQYYVSTQKYRKANSQEHYELLGWYQVLSGFDTPDTDDEDVLSAMPYVFSTPVSGDVYLRALWRLDGGYRIQYLPEYITDDGIIINDTLSAWYDPADGGTFADQSETILLRQPADIIINGNFNRSFANNFRIRILIMEFSNIRMFQSL